MPWKLGQLSNCTADIHYDKLVKSSQVAPWLDFVVQGSYCAHSPEEASSISNICVLVGNASYWENLDLIY